MRAICGHVRGGSIPACFRHPVCRTFTPPQFKEKRLAAIALDTYVWSALVPDIARRRYLRSLGFLAVGLAALTLASFLADNTTGALLGSAITAMVAWQFDGSSTAPCMLADICLGGASVKG